MCWFTSIMNCKTNCLVNSKNPKLRRAMKKRKLSKMWKPLEESGWILTFGKISAKFLSHLTWSLDHALASKIWRRYASPDSNRAIQRRDVDFFKQMNAILVRKQKQRNSRVALIDCDSWLLPSLTHCCILTQTISWDFDNFNFSSKQLLCFCFQQSQDFKCM